MELSFGARLRLQRERQQVTLGAIAAETKINLSLLEGLERDDVSRWPQGLFRRAYVRAYARAIGLEPDTVVSEFVAVYPDPTDVLRTGITIWPDPDGSVGQSEPRTALQRLVTAVTTVVPSFVQRATHRGSAVNSPDKEDEVIRHATALPPGGAESDAARSMPESDVVAAEPAGIAQDLGPADGYVPHEITVAETAQLCATLAQARQLEDAEAVLTDAVRYLGAVGLIVWIWDSPSKGLRPLLACGYSGSVLARIPMVPSDADNAVAAAFRCGDICVVAAAADLTGALVVPIVMAGGPVGAVALEFPAGSEQHESIRAFTTILAAQLGLMFGSPRFAKSKTA